MAGIGHADLCSVYVGAHDECFAETAGAETPSDSSTKKDFGDKDLFEFSVVEDQVYTGDVICPTITVKEKISGEFTDGNGENNTVELKVNEDYTVTYSNNVNVGQAEILVKPVDTQKYTGGRVINFAIKPVDVNDLKITDLVKTYKGIATKPDMEVYFNGKRLTRGKDYHVGHYKNNQDVGVASCLVKGDGNFTGSRTVEFMISPKNIYSLSYSDVTIRTYTGSAIKPSVTIIDKEVSPYKTLTKNKDYTLSYIDNTYVGTAGVIINGMGNYTGSKIVTFKIRPMPVKLVKMTKGTKKIKVTWTKQTKQLTGYEIQYSTTSKFSSPKTVRVKKTVGTKTLTKLKGKKKYYVRVRTYKSVAGIRYYSKWSNVKSVTTKK